MPGKVNPVIPEAVTMVAAQVIGNDTTITVAGQSGNFQLNVMLPVIAHNLLESIELLTNACHALADKAIATFKVRHDNLEKALAKNPILVTALNPVIGYLKAADIAKKPTSKVARFWMSLRKRRTLIAPRLKRCLTRKAHTRWDCPLNLSHKTLVIKP